MLFKYHSLTPLAWEVYHRAVLRPTTITLFLVGAVACNAGTRSPAGAVRALGEAAANGDRDAVFALVGPRTKAALESGAATAAQLSGRRRVQPVELLGVGWFPAAFTLSEAHELERHGDTATVEVSSRDNRTSRATCVKIDGAWKVELVP